jgi:hypothetical protein
VTITDDRYARNTAWISLRGNTIIDPRGGTIVVPPPDPGVQLGMLVSSVELAMWQDRRVNGPFRTGGDFSTNSPGHWTEMEAAMGLTPFQSARWSGPTNLTSGRVNVDTGGSNDPEGSVRRMAHDMMSAAYAAITVGNTTVAQAIVAEIEWQATRTNLNFGSRTLYPFNYYDDNNPLFMYAVWVKDYVLAYAVCKAMGVTSSTVEQWFLNLAELCEQIVHANLAAVFPNRKSDSYASRSSFVNSEITAHARYADGTIVYHPRIMRFYNNRRNNMAGYCGLVGVLLNNTYYKNEYKRFAREWLMFGHRITPDGTATDPNRGKDTFPQLGFSYSLHGLETMVQAMDALARQGDTSVYDFSSSDGSTHTTWGTAHAKTMQQVLNTYIRWVTNFYPAQYTGDGSPPGTYVAGVAKYRIQSRALEGTNVREMVNDGHLLLAANYYNRPDWQDAILRVGTPTGFTSTPQQQGNITGWRMDWRQRFLRSLDANPYGG